MQTPSAANYLVLKLHALRDRCERGDSDFGRHHAFDIFRVIAGMDERDWASAQEYIDLYGSEDQVEESRRIVSELFAETASVGTVRLRENVSFRPYETFLTAFIEDLVELF